MLGKTKAKYIQSLGQKKQRDTDGLFVAEGPKIVGEMLDAVPGSVKEIVAVTGWIKQQRLPPSVTVVEAGEEELEKATQLKTANQVIAVMRQFTWPPLASGGTVSLVLDTIQDPGNLGTLIRIADWFGIRQVVCSLDSVDCYNPKVVQATMGSLARVAVYYEDVASWLPRQQVRIYAADLEGKDITRMSPVTEGLIVIGNESKGISREVMDRVNERITIPRRGKAESLNAAVAAGIILSHLLK